MKVLVIGSGGREHALVWKLRQSPRVTKVYCAPGNAGIGELAALVPLAVDDFDGLTQFARANDIGLTVPAPDLPLTLGIVDEFERHGLRVFGPNRAAAQLEGSKAFTKDLLTDCAVPTAAFASFTDVDAALQYVRTAGAPIVVKADGLAAGKGVLMCATVAEAEAAVAEIMQRKAFGAAGDRVVIEEFLEGEEASFMAITDGTTVVPLASSQDHKRIGDGDIGPNTGGMGAYSPAPVVTAAVHEHVMRDIMEPVVRGLRARGIVYRGVLYAGLMIRDGQAKVIEFNVRFGDPECQVLLIRLKSDLLDAIDAVIDGRLHAGVVEWDTRAAACVVLAAEGYPSSYDKGRRIRGLDRLRGWPNGVVFHAGTAQQHGEVVTASGRVLGVTALGSDIAAAVAEAYRAVAQIGWDGMQYRKDIGHRALERR